ncbi:hypothetical protein EV356DRAFT_528003 [Viridothelium virens]|uniref:Uncharacterized protein n=1 Tax=Viridothelium virens TaxID=1048519 RepID=A0A6A6HMQ4_VIRVR|nr:hypothetical protein EV356DRAFT_528003 [Viridothelium virens]
MPVEAQQDSLLNTPFGELESEEIRRDTKARIAEKLATYIVYDQFGHTGNEIDDFFPGEAVQQDLKNWVEDQIEQRRDEEREMGRAAQSHTTSFPSGSSPIAGPSGTAAAGSSSRREIPHPLQRVRSESGHATGTTGSRSPSPSPSSQGMGALFDFRGYKSQASSGLTQQPLSVGSPSRTGGRTGTPGQEWPGGQQMLYAPSESSSRRPSEGSDQVKELGKMMETVEEHRSGGGQPGESAKRGRVGGSTGSTGRGGGGGGRRK